MEAHKTKQNKQDIKLKTIIDLIAKPLYNSKCPSAPLYFGRSETFFWETCVSQLVSKIDS